MCNLKELKSFLVKAGENTWAAENELAENHEEDFSTTYKFEEGDWKYEDNFFGEDPTGGREVVYFKGKPVWMKTYYGSVYDESPGQVYSFLKRAKLNEETKASEPFHGPDRFEDNGFKYISNNNGGLDMFSGEDLVYKDGEEVYTTIYSGGLVNSMITRKKAD